ncbi:hypothetical protein [Kitasatospora sp. NPDC057500]|uniref:hypothetical protein n=1 Tax=Kitasatospora sp. NPDC057500 TaxID=3346151 RepID=UPI003680BB36
MAFPATPLGVQVELQVSGTWTDVTGDAYLRDPITIERGRPDEGSRIDPGKCPITLDNRSGTYSPRNPMSPYFGLIGRNTPVRVSVADPALPTYLDLPGPGSYASTPDTAVLDLTGDFDVRIDLTLPATQAGIVEVAAKYTVTGNQRSWQLTLQDDVPTLRWSTDGTAVIDRTATLPLPLPASGRLAIRAALDADTGTGGHAVTFWTAPTIAGPWAQLGDVVTATGTTSVYASTAPLTLGDNPGQTVVAPVGRVHAFQLRGAGGALVAAPDFTALAPGTTAWSDTAGRAWTLAGGATIPPRRSVRFTGEASAWSPRRDVSGQDRWVPIEAAGIKRRLGQGTDPLASTLRRSLTAAAPVAYWPMEDARGASQAFSPIPGCPPLVATGLEFAAGDGPTGSLPLPRVSHGATISAPVPDSPALAAGWRVEMVYNLPALPTAGVFPPVLRIATTGKAVQWFVAIDAAFVTVFATDGAGGVVTNTGTAPAGHASGGWARLQLDVWDDGAGGTAWEVRFFLIGSAALGSVWNTHAGPPGVPTAIDTLFDEALGDMQLGHLSVMPTSAGDAYGHADNGFEGNRPVERIARLCTEEAVPFTSMGLVDPQIALGPQQAAPLLDLLEEAGEVDGSYLVESRQTAGLHYRPAYLSYNQQPALVLDYAAGDVAPPLEPVDDDQSTRNDITVTRRGGSSARAVAEDGPLSVQAPPAGIGRYADTPELNLYRDHQLADVAGWRLHLGTWDAARYRRVRVDLAACPHLIPAAAAVEVGDMIRIINLPAEDGPTTVDLIAQGYTEQLGAYDWALEFTTTPAGPWSVAVTDDLVLASADTAGSTLATGATATATTLSIATTGPLWSTDPADYPLDLAIAGERVTVTAMAGTTSPQTATVTRSVNGVSKPLPAGADVRLWQPAILAL